MKGKKSKQQRCKDTIITIAILLLGWVLYQVAEYVFRDIQPHKLRGLISLVGCYNYHIGLLMGVLLMKFTSHE